MDSQSPLAKNRSAIVPYCDRWPDQFSVAFRTLKDALGDSAISIRHIGSTAIPGLAAKNRIDIQVSICDLSVRTKSEIDRALRSIGLRETEQFEDHRPPGNTSSEENWLKFLSWGRIPSWDFDANIHFRVLSHDNHQFAILFRDFLKANKDATEAYERVKKMIKKYLPEDHDAYNEIKDPVVDMIVIAAKEWAEKNSWSEPAD